MPQRTVVYLGLLGFKNYTGIDAAAASQLLLDYHQIINTKLADMAHFPANADGDPGWRILAQGPSWRIGELPDPSFRSAIPCLSSLTSQTCS